MDDPGAAGRQPVGRRLREAAERCRRAEGHASGAVARVQQEGTCWLGGTRWKGAAAMRVSVSGWQTTEEDADRSADAIAAAWRWVH